MHYVCRFAARNFAHGQWKSRAPWGPTRVNISAPCLRFSCVSCRKALLTWLWPTICDRKDRKFARLFKSPISYLNYSLVWGAVSGCLRALTSTASRSIGISSPTRCAYIPVVTIIEYPGIWRFFYCIPAYGISQACRDSTCDPHLSPLSATMGLSIGITVASPQIAQQASRANIPGPCLFSCVLRRNPW